MTAQVIFKIASTIVLPGWVALIFWPTSPITHLLLRKALLPILLSAIYFASFFYSLAHPVQTAIKGGFDSLESVRALFQNDWALLAGWIHYLAFDLLIGVKIVDDLSRSGRNKIGFRVPLLFFTFMLGPIGFLFSRAVTSNEDR